MNVREVDTQIRELLQKCSYSNDNFVRVENNESNKEKAESSGISIVGDHNIIIDTGIFHVAFILFIAYMWVSLLNH